MTRLQKIIKAFNDYDNFVKNNTLIGFFEQKGLDDNSPEKKELDNIRTEVSILIGELKRYGCKKEN